VTRCNLCDRDAVERLIDFGSHPIAHQLLDAPDAETYRHPVVLGLCEACALVQLVDPIPPHRLYSSYNWLSSWKWNPHVPSVLDLLEGLPGLLKDSAVLEVGSNDGSFLAGLRSRGYSRLLGIEPADDARAAAAERGVETAAGYFGPDAARAIADSFGPCDLLIARHVLEHVTELAAFAEAARIVLRRGGYALVEVPDFGFSQRARDYSAIWEEHVNHFTPATLRRLLGRIGIDVQRLETVTFSGQALVAIGRRTDDGGSDVAPDEAAELRAQAEAYRDDWPRFRAAIDGYLADRRREGRRIALYGAGCRASTLVNYCDLGRHLELVVDDQPEKQGKFMPGSGLPIVGGEALSDDGIDLCLLAVNAENEEAVIARRREFAERGGEFVSLHPPSPRLPPFWKAA
jgi:SAM-dependent methyltransferase